MKKVALVSLYPLSSENPSIGRNIVYAAYAFRKLGMHCEFFSMSQKTRSTKAFGFKQHEARSSRPLGSKFSNARYADLLSLMAFGRRPNVERMNDCPELLKALAAYEPDLVLFADTITAKLANKYATDFKKPGTKIISISDSCKGISAEIEDNIHLLRLNGANPAKISLLKHLLKKRYIRYHQSLYELQVRLSDAFIVPSQEHVKEVRSAFPTYKNKIFSLYPEWRVPASMTSKPPRKNISMILFIGSYTHAPNAIAIKSIVDVIAPQVPDIQFIIFGFGCPDKTVGNVRFINGEKLSSESVLSQADLCIVPLTCYNAGIRTKIMDYVAAGKIVMGTRESFIGYKAVNNFNSIIEDQINKYPERISRLGHDYKLRCMVQKNTTTLLKGYQKNDVLNGWRIILKAIGLQVL